MNKFFLSILFTSFFLSASSQFYTDDSLVGCDIPKIIREAHQKNFFGLETKVFVKASLRDFLIKKYNLAQSGSEVSSHKSYSSNTVANAPCINEGFEAVPTGSLSSGTSGWTVSETQNSYPNTLLCSQSLTFNTPTLNTNAIVVATPYIDSRCNNVPNSPFGGSHVLQLNGGNGNSLHISRITQQFNVTSSNCFFNYAYKAAFQASPHNCCDVPSLTVRFYDCVNNLINTWSHTIVHDSDVCVVNTFSCGLPSKISWVGGGSPGGWVTTSNWVEEGVNLSQYIGSCVRVEVTASDCTGGAHAGYCYFDSECSATGGFVANGTFQSSSSYSSCVSSASLSALPCFSNYLWQGPLSSSVAGATSSVISTSVPGSYTVTASTGTFVSTQVINLGFVTNFPTVTITANSYSGCIGSTFTLQAAGNGFSAIAWPNYVSSSTLTVTPSVGLNVYTVAVTNSLGCSVSDSKTISIYPLPTVQIVPSGNSLCTGQPTVITALSNSANTFTWNTGATTSTTTLIPSNTQNSCTVQVSTVYGCTASAIAYYFLSVTFPLQIYTNALATICRGEAALLSASGQYFSTYSWSTGDVGFASQIWVSPTVTTVYTVSAIDTLNSCESKASTTITVLDCLGLEGETGNSAKDLRVFPNPANETFIIKTSAPSKVEIVNAEGGLLREVILSAENGYFQKVENLEKGIYIVRSKNESVKVLLK